MAIMTRLLRLWKADLHGVMDQMEDKGLLFKQYLREMEDSLRQKIERQQLLSHTMRQLRRDLDQRRQEVGKLDQDIDLAINKSKDDIARGLIYKRHHLEAGCGHMAQQLALISEEQQHLDQVVIRQQLQLDQMKLKVDAYLCHEQVYRQDAGESSHPDLGGYGLTNDEVELELLQRKEALDQGGAT